MVSSSHQHDEPVGSLLAKDLYFREIKRIPRLSAEEEQRYLARLARGQAEQGKPEPDQWRLLLAQDARTRLAESYQGLVVHVARGYARCCHCLQYSDLLQEGNVGLLHALDQLDHTDPRRFCSYAAACIKYTILAAIEEQDALLSPSHHFRRLLRQARQVEQRLRQEQGSEPSLAQIAAALHLEVAQLQEAYELAERQAVKRLDDVLASDEDEGEERMLRLLGDSDPAVGDTARRQAGLRETLREAIAGLSGRQREVLRLRYGLDDERPEECSIEEIAQRLGCSANAVRTAEIRAYQHLARRLQVEVGPDGWQCQMREDAARVAQEVWYTRQEVARLLGWSPATVYHKAQAGELPTLRDARSPWPVYPKAAIERILVERQQQASVEQDCYRWQEAMARLGCSRNTLRRYVRLGKVPALELGRDQGRRIVGYPRVAIEALVQERRISVA